MREMVAERLIERKEELARTITARLYQELPDLLEKYGERGRSKCLEDMRYNLEHLAPAVALGEVSLFAHYCVWLRDMLAARGVAEAEIVRSLHLTNEVIRTQFAPDQVRLVTEAVDAALAALEKRPE